MATDQRQKFTQHLIDTLPPGAPAGTWWSDTETEGLYCVSYASGLRVFKVRLRTNGRRRVVKLGRADRITITMARAKARQLLAQAELGRDPAAEKERARKMLTFDGWRKVYISRIELRKKSPREDRRFLARAAKRWAHVPLDQITRADVAALHQSLGKSHATAANRFLASVRASFSEAVREGLVSVNPATGVKHHREAAPRARVLTEAEMGAVLAAIAAESDLYARAGFRLLAETGARLSEALRAQWPDVDLDGGTWRVPSPKSGHPQIIPLGRSTVALLRHLPHVEKCPYIIVGRHTDRPRTNLRDAWDRVKATAAKTVPSVHDIHVHDLRRSFGLAIARSHGLHIASKLLRHSSTKVTEDVYAPLGIDELRMASQKRSDALPFAAKERAGR